MTRYTSSMVETRPLAEVFRERKERHWLIDFSLRLVREKKMGAAGGALVLAILLMAVFADVIAPYGYNDVNPADRFLPSFTPGHVLGTDSMGRDLLSRVIHGARVSMYVGLGAVAIGTAAATILGLVCGYFGGKFDAVVQRLVDAWMCFPFLVILLTIMAIIGPGFVNLVLTLALLLAFGNSRVIRGAVLSVRENQYIEAAQSLGCSNLRILFQHILPNIVAPVIVLATVAIGNVILAEASISFLGYGVPPPAPSWGAMLSGTSRSYMLLAPWLAFWPGLAISLGVFGFNMFGDALRDLLDPRQRGAAGRLS